jgi:hypothetical protein
MPLRRHFVFMAFAVFLAVNAWPALAQDPTRGQVTVGGQAVAFGPPLGLFDQAQNRVSLAFVSKPLPPDVEAASRAALAWDVRGAGPAVVIDLEFTPGAFSAMVGQLTACSVVVHGFRAPLSLTGSAQDCHVTSIGGLLRPMGGVIGLLEGEGPTYALRLPFSMSLPAASTTATAAESQASPERPAATPPAAAPGIPLHTVAGFGTFTGQKPTVTHGFAWWVAEDNEVRLALFDHAPSASMMAEVRSGSWGEGGPIMTITVRLKPGVQPGPEAVTYCYVDVRFPKGGPMALNTNSATRCGLTDMGGDPRAGGSFAAQLRGQAPGPGDQPFTWNVRFHLPIAR